MSQFDLLTLFLRFIPEHNFSYTIRREIAQRSNE